MHEREDEKKINKKHLSLSRTRTETLSLARAHKRAHRSPRPEVNPTARLFLLLFIYLFIYFRDYCSPVCHKASILLKINKACKQYTDPKFRNDQHLQMRLRMVKHHHLSVIISQGYVSRLVRLCSAVFLHCALHCTARWIWKHDCLRFAFCMCCMLNVATLTPKFLLGSQCQPGMSEFMRKCNNLYIIVYTCTLLNACFT